METKAESPSQLVSTFREIALEIERQQIPCTGQTRVIAAAILTTAWLLQK